MHFPNQSFLLLRTFAFVSCVLNVCNIRSVIADKLLQLQQLNVKMDNLTQWAFIKMSHLLFYAGIITLYPKIIRRTRLLFPASSGCRMTKSYQHPVCNVVIQYSARSSEGSHKLIDNELYVYLPAPIERSSFMI